MGKKGKKKAGLSQAQARALRKQGKRTGERAGSRRQAYHGCNFAKNDWEKSLAAANEMLGNLSMPSATRAAPRATKPVAEPSVLKQLKDRGLPWRSGELRPLYKGLSLQAARKRHLRKALAAEAAEQGNALAAHAAALAAHAAAGAAA